MFNVGDPYFLYMAEAEGLDHVVDTHLSRLNAVVNEIRDYPGSRISESYVREIFAEHGIYDPTFEDWDYVERNIR